MGFWNRKGCRHALFLRSGLNHSQLSCFPMIECSAWRGVAWCGMARLSLLPRGRKFHLVTADKPSLSISCIPEGSYHVVSVWSARREGGKSSGKEKNDTTQRDLYRPLPSHKTSCYYHHHKEMRQCLINSSSEHSVHPSIHPFFSLHLHLDPDSCLASVLLAFGFWPLHLH